jgi:hypothetical protein
MERLIGPAGQLAVHGDEIPRSGGLARNDDLILAETALEGESRRFDRREDHALVDDRLGRQAEAAIGVLLHLRDHQILVQRPSVHADAYGLAVIGGHLADRGELLVAAASRSDVAGVDAVLVERPGAAGKLREEKMTVVVEIADERRGTACVDHPPLDLRHGLGRFGQVHRDPDHFRSGCGELDALLGGRTGVRRVGHGHRLNDNRGAAANLDRADLHADRLVNFEQHARRSYRAGPESRSRRVDSCLHGEPSQPASGAEIRLESGDRPPSRSRRGHIMPSKAGIRESATDA